MFDFSPRRDELGANCAKVRLEAGRQPLSAIFNAALNNTFAPLTQSSHSVNSSGEWLTPSREGTKIMPASVRGASDCASCPAPDGIAMWERPSDSAAAAMAARVVRLIGAGVDAPAGSR